MNEPPRILVVDDNPLVLRATSRILRAAHYTVIEASNGEEGLRLAREHTPDLILLDVVMDEPDGVETCQRIKADPALASTFVILFSGVKTASDYQAEGIESGADGYITRPISNRELVARVQAMLRIKAAEDELRNAKEFSDNLIALMQDGFSVLDARGVHIRVNAALCQMTGLTEAELIGVGAPHPYWPPEEYATIEQAFQRTLRGDFDHFELTFMRKDGTRFPVIVSPSWIKDEQGNVVSYFATIKDITERKRAENALRESEEKYRQVVEHAYDGIVIADDKRLVFANAAFAQMSGYSIEELNGIEFLKLVPPEQQAMVAERVRRRLAGEDIPSTYVIDLVRKDGTTFSVEVNAGKIDYHGKPHDLVLMRDITERQRAEEALRVLSARYQAILAAVPDIVMEVDNNKVYTWANQAGLEFFGAEVIGKPADFYFEGEQKTYHIVQPLFNGKEDVIYLESWQRRCDGEKRLLAWWCRTLKDARGNVVGALSTARDITDQQRAQAALQEYSTRLEQMVDERTRELRAAQERLLQQERLTTLGQIAGGIGHELRSPLAAIKNAAYLLRQLISNPDAETREALEILERQVDASARTITNLLALARPQQPTRHPTDLRAALDAALAQSALPENIVVQREFADALPEISADPDQLQIVFSNLIRNAAQAMPEGGVLTMSARQRSAVSGQPPAIEIRVADTGIGIPPDALEKIFQPLYTTKARGIGLGLALCKLIVEAHGGAMTVASALGKGTTFTVTLPVE